MKNFKVAAAQLSPVFLNKEKTIEKACAAIKEAGEKAHNTIYALDRITKIKEDMFMNE